MLSSSAGLAVNASSDFSENGISTNESEPGQKRIRACVACRNMKIKCVSVPGAKDCESCLRFSRPCQDPGPPKARMKTSQKFTELEKKIDALTSALDAERRRNQQTVKQVKADALWSKTPESNARDDYLSPIEQRNHELGLIVDDGRMNATTRGDIVDQGLVDMFTATLLFDHWNTHMRPIMPVIQFSTSEDVYTIRAKKPTLFLTIMMVASTAIKPSLVPSLLARLNNILAQDVFIQGVKSLDLLQSLILFSQYYVQPPQIGTFALPQHMYCAVVMSHDLGLGTIPKLKEKENEDQIKETYRTLLAVYFGASCAATFLRRYQPLLFTSSHRESIEALTRAGGRETGDKWLCSLVTLQEIFDDASKTMNTAYGRTDESFDDFRTQHILGIFRQRLDDWKSSPSGDIDIRLKNHAASIADLYIHQVAIRVYCHRTNAWLSDKGKHDPSQSQPVFSVMHIDALCHCLKVIARAFNIYLSLDDATTRSLPNIFLIWNLCAAVSLIKLSHFSSNISQYQSSSQDSYDPPSVTLILEAMVQKLIKLSIQGYFPQSRPFIVAFKKLNIWVQQKKIVCLNNNGTCDEGSSEPVHDLMGTQTPPMSPLDTELPMPTQAQIGNQGDQFGLDTTRNGPNAISQLQAPDWAPNSITAGDATITNATFDSTYDPNYFTNDLGDIGFDLNDMRDIDNFMTQTDDGGLWSLL